MEFCCDMAPSSCESVPGSRDEMMLEMLLGGAAGAGAKAFGADWVYCGIGGL